ncbi:hypothetical protein THRCLA_03806 [Thraustotheca clavata]|uniref:Ion transport domain-containing protein n=1 Tax=Thraustotheca clavata TaxID=74557 RepID=A0A1W0A1J2_9STRA|nr:hypothetical protein THRCLA_03806 [Thraustotheca clavata]
MYLLICLFFVPMKLGAYGVVDRAIQVGSGGVITIFLWILFLQFLEVVPNTSYLLPLTARLMKDDVWNFFLFLEVFQIGLTITYYYIFVDMDDDAFGTLFQSFYSAYFVLFGQFPTDSLGSFNTTSSSQANSQSNEYYLYIFTVILMMFHATALDGGLERAHTKALASYAKSILHLEVSNYSEEENEKLMCLLKDRVNLIFTDPVHKAKQAIAMRENNIKKWETKVLDAVQIIRLELDHVKHFTVLAVYEVLKNELGFVDEAQDRIKNLFNQFQKCRDHITMLQKIKKLVNETMLLLYEMTYKRNLIDSIKLQQDFINNYLDSAIHDAEIALKKEPKVSDLMPMLEDISNKLETPKQETKTTRHGSNR